MRRSRDISRAMSPRRSPLPARWASLATRRPTARRPTTSPDSAPGRRRPGGVRPRPSATPVAPTPQRRGRSAAAALIKGGSDTIVAMPSLSGIGAMRETCGRKARLVGVGIDAWQAVPDARPCLIAGVLNRYDTAVSTALLALAAGTALPQRVMNDVSNDGIAVSQLRAARPGWVRGRSGGRDGDSQERPARPTPAPTTPRRPGRRRGGTLNDPGAAPPRPYGTK